MSAELRESVADRIKRDVPLLGVAGEYAEQIKRHGRLHVCRCLCGQNSDRNPSFTLYDDHFYCFACNRHGSVIDLVMLVEGLDFKAAVEHLRSQYLLGQEHGDRPHRIVHPPPATAIVKRAVRDEVQKVLDAATDYYQSALLRTPTVLEYLYMRGLNDETIRRLRIGYARGGLGRALFEWGFDLMLAARAGLISPRGEFLRGRIVFPVLDARGAPLWMIGRAVKDDDEPKYLGLPEDLVHKQPMMMGSARRGSIWVEGALDFAALVQWDLAEDFLLVGLLGTAFEAIVQKLLTRLTPHATICMDQDLAGKLAALKLATLLTQHGIQPSVITDADRQRLVVAWVERAEKKSALSDHEREKLPKGQGELAVVEAMSMQHLIRWVQWGNKVKDPSDLCKMGEQGRQMFLDALPT